jgi:uncharacterized protein (TIGR02246 family)
VDKDKTNPRPTAQPLDPPGLDSPVDDLYRKLRPEMRRPKPSPDAIAAALESAQRLAAEADAESASDDLTQALVEDSLVLVCSVCGYRNRDGNKFCGMCGIAVSVPGVGVTSGAEDSYQASQALAQSPNSFLEREIRPPTTRPTGQETHHYHHHYHHHYFPGAQDGPFPRAQAEPLREEKLRPNAAQRGDMSRSEAAVRRITQEWVLACNTKHLDDLLELYISDALVLRSNYLPIRGAAAIREFFFGALDAGLGEVEVDPMRVDVAGDLAYEAGRCKALIPSATGKRREERGKYLWVFSRQSNGEWKLAADCWSSDLTLSALESDIPPTTGVRTGQPRKNS